jgi:chromosome segregation ATPase
MGSNRYNFFECRSSVRKKSNEKNERLASEVEEPRDVKERLQEREKEDEESWTEYAAESLTSQIEEWKGEKENLCEKEKEAMVLRIKCDYMKYNMTRLLEVHRSTVRENQCLIANNERLSSETEKLKVKMHRLNEGDKHVRLLKTEHESMGVSVTELTEDINRAERERRDFKAAKEILATEFEKQSEELENIRERENKAKALGTKCYNMKCHITELVEKRSRILRENECLQKENERLSSETVKITNQLHRLRKGDTKLQLLTNQHEKMRLVVTQLMEDISRAERERQALKEVKEYFVSEFEELSEELENIRGGKKSKTLRAECHNMQSNIKMLAEKCSHVLRKNECLHEENERLSSETVKLTRELHRLHRGDKESQSLRTLHENMRVNVIKQTEDISRAKRERQVLKAAKESLVSKFEELSEELENIPEREKKAETLRAECHNMQSNIKMLAEKCSHVLRENECLHEENERLSSETVKLTQELHRIHRGDKESQLLRTLHENMRVNMTGQMEDISRAEREREVMKAAKEILVSEFEELSVELENIPEREKKAETLRAECHNMQSNIKMLAEKCSHVLGQNECLHEENERLSSETVKLTQELHGLRKGDKESQLLRTLHENTKVNMTEQMEDISHAVGEKQVLKASKEILLRI